MPVALFCRCLRDDDFARERRCLMWDPNEMGRSEGNERGPKPGDGAVVHQNSGEADFDGLPGDVLPPKKDAKDDEPAPPGESAD